MVKTLQLTPVWLTKFSNGLYTAFLNVFSTFFQVATPIRLWLNMGDFTKFQQLLTQLDELYYEMTVKANAVNIVNPIVETETFVSKMNKLIADTNLAYKQHKAQLGLWTEEWGWEDEEKETSEEVKEKE